MHSKIKIWDFLKTYPSGLPPSGRIFAITCYDSFALKFIRNRFPKEKFHEEKLNILLGQELTTSWIDDNFHSLGLFGNEESYLIHGAEDISEPVLESLFQPKNLILSNRYLILNFHKDNKAFKRLQKDDSQFIDTLHILAPSFWEEKALLEFLCVEMNISLSKEVSEFIQNNISFDIASYSNFLEQLSLNFPIEKVISDLEIVASLSSTSKIDQFELLELFATKKLRQFYPKFLQAMESGHEMIPLLYLIQGHFIKLYDPSYLEGKVKLTKYDRNLQGQLKLWTKNDIYKVIDYLGELVILAKKKTSSLEKRIKQDQVRLIRF